MKRRLALTLAFLWVQGVASEAQKVAETFLDLQEFGLVRISPDHHWAAVEIRRSRGAMPPVLGDFGFDARSNLWLLDLRQGTKELILDGSRDGSGAWAPVWSDDSRRFAFITNRGNRAVPRLAVWDLPLRKVIFEGSRGISLESNFGSDSPYPPAGRIAFRWLTRDRILTVLLPKAGFDPFFAPSNPQILSQGMWTRATSGQLSATVWDTRDLVPCGIGNELTVIDLKSHKIESLAHGAIRAVSVSPNHSAAVVVLATSVARRNAAGVLPEIHDWNSYSMDPSVETEALYLDLEGGEVAGGRITGVHIPFLSARTFPRWSASGRIAYVPVFEDGGRESLFRIDGKKAERLDPALAAKEAVNAGISPDNPAVPDTVLQVHGAVGQDAYLVQYRIGKAEGLGLWRRAGGIHSLHTINEKLNSSHLPEPVTLELGSADSSRLARVLYPDGYQTGRRYPTVLFAYPGLVFREHEAQFLGRKYRPSLTFEDIRPYYLRALGYIVVQPSLPLQETPGGDILQSIARELDASAESLVSRGISDPQRMGYYGHSYGAYAGLALAVDSAHPFAAIAVSAAFADLFYYSTYVPDTFRRSACAPSATRARTHELESRPAVLDMRTPPHADLSRYLANSALYRADEISVPLLMLHGEFDMVPIESVEHLFMVLESRNVPARLVRYWGDGHEFYNAENMKNSLEEVGKWFEQYLQASNGGRAVTSD